MIKFYYRESLTKELESADKFKPGTWIHGEGLSDEEIFKLAEEFNLEEGHLRDALDPFEVPRLEMEGETAYIFLRVPEKRKEGIVTVPLLIILADNFVVTISRERSLLLEKFTGDVYKFYTTQKIEFFYQLVFAINAAYTRRLADINKRVRGLKVRIERIENSDIIQFVDFEQILNDFISALIPTTTILRSLARGVIVPLQEEGKDLIEDLLLSNEQLVEFTKSTLKNIVNIRDAYSTIMTQDLNRVIKILTSLTILVTVPTMISSFYGMNVKLPFDQSPFAFIGILMTTVVSMAILLYIFIKNRWL